MFAHERSLVQKFEGRPFVLLGVSADDSAERLQRSQEKFGLTWRSWWDGDGALARAWEVDRFPTLVLIDHRGAIGHRFTGAPDQAELESRVEELVSAVGR